MSNNPEVGDLLTQCVECMSAGKHAAAEKVAREVLALDKKNLDAYLHLGNALVCQNKVDEGIEALKKALVVDPESFDARYGLASAYFLSSDYVEAVKQLNKLEEQRPTLAIYAMLEAIFIDTGDYIQALRYANKAVELEPLNASPYLDKTQILLLLEKPREAAACLQDVRGLLPDAGEVYLMESRVYEQMGESRKALEILDVAVERFGSDPVMLLAKGRLLNDMEKPADALEVLEKARSLAGDDADFLREVSVQVSIARAGLEDADGSLKELEDLAASGNADDQSMFLLINGCYVLERYEDVVRYCDELLALEDAAPRFVAAAIYWKASSLKDLGRKAEAEAAFRQAVFDLRSITIENPGILEAYLYRAMSHKELGQFDEALHLVDHLITVAPGDASGYAFKYDILMAKGDAAEAERARQKVLEIDPSYQL